MTYKDLESTIKEIIKNKGPLNLRELSLELDVRPEALLEVLHNVRFIETERSVTALIHNRSYLIYGYYYCSCKDFYMKNLVKHRNQACKHILALACHRAARGCQETFSLSAEANPKPTTIRNTSKESANPM